MTDNALIVFVRTPTDERLSEVIENSFEDSRLSNTYIEMAKRTFAKLKNFRKIKLIPVYEFNGKYPDLRWLNNDDPGFLAAKGDSEMQRLIHAVNWAFDTGAKKVGVVWLDMFCIDIGQISQAFEMLEQKQLALGVCKNKNIYFVGFNRHYDTIFKELKKETDNVFNSLQDLSEKLAINVYLMPETYRVTDENSYRQWISDTKKTCKTTACNELFSLTASGV